MLQVSIMKFAFFFAVLDSLHKTVTKLPLLQLFLVKQTESICLTRTFIIFFYYSPLKKVTIQFIVDNDIIILVFILPVKMTSPFYLIFPDAHSCFLNGNRS